MIKAGFARIVWQRIRSVDQLQQGDAADAEYRNLSSVLLHGQTKHVAIVGGDAIEIADHQADGTDVDRARLAAVGTAEGLGASMRLLYGPVGAATQLARYVRCTFESGHASRSDRQKQLGSIPFSWRGRCPLWVISGHFLTFCRIRFYLRKRTSAARSLVFVLCHQRTSPYIIRLARRRGREKGDISTKREYPNS